jgi:hypothetical protein
MMNGIRIIGRVASNFITGPTGVNGSTNINATVPIKQHKIPAAAPKIKKQATHIILTGSIQAMPHASLGKYGAVIKATTAPRAPKMAAPTIPVTESKGFSPELIKITYLTK